MTDTATDLDPARLAAAIDTHLAAYGEADGAVRDDLIRRVWSEDGVLVDPPLEGRGHAGISDLTPMVHAHFPGHTFRRTTAVDAHHGVARYGWELVGADGTVAISGVDVAEFTSDGRLARIVGFFGDLQPAA